MNACVAAVLLRSLNLFFISLRRQAESQTQTMTLELESLQSELEAALDAVRGAEKAVKEAADEALNIEMKVGEVRARYEEAKRALDELEDRMSHFSAEVVGLKHARTDLEKKAEKATLEAKKITVTIGRIKKERANAEQLVSTLQKKYPWIESEISAFGVPGGDYDFEAVDTNEIGKQLKKLKAEQESLVSHTRAQCVEFIVSDCC